MGEILSRKPDEFFPKIWAAQRNGDLNAESQRPPRKDAEKAVKRDKCVAAKEHKRREKISITPPFAGLRRGKRIPQGGTRIDANYLELRANAETPRTPRDAEKTCTRRLGKGKDEGKRGHRTAAQQSTA